MDGLTVGSPFKIMKNRSFSPTRTRKVLIVVKMRKKYDKTLNLKIQAFNKGFKSCIIICNI